MKEIKKKLAFTLVLLAGFGCADLFNPDKDKNRNQQDTFASFSVGGTVSGLTGTVVLSLNSQENLTVNNNGSFVFSGKLLDLSGYAIAVNAQPAGETCTVTNGSGKLAGANASNATITCTTAGISVTVTNATTNNTNKAVAAPAVQLWAVTTLYETAGFTTEKVQLADQGGGTFTGTLPINTADASARTVIVFDDVVTRAHPYGGTYHGSDGSGSHTLISTDDFFSPCSGLRGRQQGTGGAAISVADLVATTIMGAANPPRLPVLNTVGDTPGSNDEVHAIISGQNPSDTINVDYTTFTTANATNFCNCTRSISIAQYSSSTTPANRNPDFTDTNFGTSGGACGPRMP